jgi:hypothetical protein
LIKPAAIEGVMKKVLLAGETFTLVQSAVAGVTFGNSSRYANGATYFLAAMEGSGRLFSDHNFGCQRVDAVANTRSQEWPNRDKSVSLAE